jgi:hypothetical protein
MSYIRNCGILILMKKIIKYSSIKYGWRLFLLLAVSGTWLLFVSQFSQWFTQVQANEFGSALDVIIVYIAFAATLFILFIALLVGAGAGHLLGAIFEAAIFAAVQIQRATIFSLGLAIDFFRSAILPRRKKISCIETAGVNLRFFDYFWGAILTYPLESRLSLKFSSRPANRWVAYTGRPSARAWLMISIIEAAI